MRAWETGLVALTPIRVRCVAQCAEKKCCQGIRGKFGQTTVAPIKAWRGSPAEPPRPLTARLAKPRPPSRATLNLHPIDESHACQTGRWAGSAGALLVRRLEKRQSGSPEARG